MFCFVLSLGLRNGLLLVMELLVSVIYDTLFFCCWILVGYWVGDLVSCCFWFVLFVVCCGLRCLRMITLDVLIVLIFYVVLWLLFVVCLFTLALCLCIIVCLWVVCDCCWFNVRLDLVDWCDCCFEICWWWTDVFSWLFGWWLYLLVWRFGLVSFTWYEWFTLRDCFVVD